MYHQPSLILQPCQNSYADILLAFQSGKPLTVDQLNFLLWHARQLSTAHLDPVLKYYKIGQHRHYHSCIHSFLVADELDNKESTHRFQEKLESILQEQHHGIMAKFSLTQFEHLMAVEHIPHLVYFDGNRIVVESPLIRGKKAHAYFFQWGSIIGIVRYEIVREAPISETNAIVYFEERRKRELTEFIHDFYLKYNADIEFLINQQLELQERFHKLQLQKEIIQKEVLEKELLAYQQKLTVASPAPHYQPAQIDHTLADQLQEQERLEHEKEFQQKILQEELLEAEELEEVLSEQQRLEKERIAQEKLEETISEQKRLEKDQEEKEKLKAQIPDLHKEYSPSSIFPPRYVLRPIPPPENKHE